MNDLQSTNGSWSGLRQQLRKTWGELTDEDLDAIARDREQLVQIVLNRYACGPPRSMQAIQARVPMAGPQLDCDIGRATVRDQAVSNDTDVRI